VISPLNCCFRESGQEWMAFRWTWDYSSLANLGNLPMAVEDGPWPAGPLACPCLGIGDPMVGAMTTVDRDSHRAVVLAWRPDKTVRLG
jgi:hypothetical protein